MADTRTAVLGLYANRIQTEGVVNALMQAGFSGADISLLMPEDEPVEPVTQHRHSRAPEGTATGLAAGGAIGGTLGLLAGIGSLAVPGLGPLLVAGPIVATLAGIGAGTTVGGVLGALVGLGIPEYEARRYEGRVKRGAILLSVHCDSREEVRRATTVLEHTGAEEIVSAVEQSGTEANAMAAARWAE